MSPDWIIASSSLLAAIGTVAAVGVAVHRDWFREKKRRPRLEMSFDPVDWVQNLDMVTVGPGHDLVHWIRPRVSNAKGCRSAEKVEVFLLRCEQRHPKRAQTPVNERPLSWSGVREPDGVTRITRTVIPPAVTRHIDLLSIQRENGTPKASLRVVPVPREERHKFLRGEFDIELVLAARDVDATRYVGSIRYDGGWDSADDMWEHIDVRIAKMD